VLIEEQQLAATDAVVATLAVPPLTSCGMVVVELQTRSEEA
jgi:hypothetical protein